MFQVFKRIMKRRVYSAFWYSLRFTALSSTALLLKLYALPRVRLYPVYALSSLPIDDQFLEQLSTL